MSENLSDLVSSLKEGLQVTTLVVCVALVALAIAWITIGN